MTEEDIRRIVRDEISRHVLRAPTLAQMEMEGWFKNQAQEMFGAGPSPLTDEAQARMA